MRELKKKTEDLSPQVKKEISRLRSEARKTKQELTDFKKESVAFKRDINAFTGIVSGNYWTQII